MKALVLKEQGGPLHLEDVPVPKPGNGEVLVRVRACGLGLTLVWNLKGRGFGRGTIPDKVPRIIGHEIAGDVVETGTNVNTFKAGDRVNVYFYLTCGSCRWCNVGREDLCDNHAGYVGRQIDGGLAEYVVLPERNLCHIPPEMGYVDAAVTADAIATPGTCPQGASPSSCPGNRTGGRRGRRCGHSHGPNGQGVRGTSLRRGHHCRETGPGPANREPMRPSIPGK